MPWGKAATRLVTGSRVGPPGTLSKFTRNAPDQFGPIGERKVAKLLLSQQASEAGVTAIDLSGAEAAQALDLATPVGWAKWGRDAAKGVAETTGRALARDAFEAIPGVGSLVSAVGFAHDLNHAFQDYLACTGGVW